MPDGKVMHAELQLGNVKLMLADEFPDMGYISPSTLNGSPVSLHLSVDKVDTLIGKAIEYGAVIKSPASDQFDGERRGSFTDPFGHIWLIASRNEIVSPSELLVPPPLSVPNASRGLVKRFVLL